MGRREYRATFRCATGCGESITYVCEGRDEYAGALKRNAAKPWKCTRHADPDRNLRPGNEQTRQVLIATRMPSRFPDKYPYNTRPGWEWLDGLFWVPEGATTGSGYTSGPGFNAHAGDFPEGTRLVVTAEIQMPAVEAREA